MSKIKNSNESKSEFKSNNESKFVASGKLAEGYTVIPNEIMNDIDILDANAFTVFAKILQYITNPKHKITVQGLAAQLKWGKTRVSNSINKLIEVGYIRRSKIKNGNLTCGYLYEVFSEKQIVDNDSEITNVNEKNDERKTVGNTKGHRNTHSEDTGTEDTDVKDTEYGYTNNNYSNKDNNNNNSFNNNYNYVDVVDKEKQLFDLYKSFKLEKRFTPHVKKLLLSYIDVFDIDVFEKVFIAASDDSVAKKYAYMKKVFETLDEKHIRTIKDYEKDQEDYRGKKATVNKQSKNDNSNNSDSQGKKVVTRYHNSFNEHHKNYTSEQLDEKLNANKGRRDMEKELYLSALENGLEALSKPSKDRVIAYATSHNLDIPN